MQSSKLSIIASDQLKLFVFLLVTAKTSLEAIYKYVFLRDTSPCWYYMKNLHPALLITWHAQPGYSLPGRSVMPG